MAVAAKDAAVVHFLAFYYSQVIGLPAWLYGLSAFVAQAVDAFADPVLGTLSDNSRTRFGRRHPWMAVSALPIGVGFLLRFAPPSDPTNGRCSCWIALVQTGAPRPAVGLRDPAHRRSVRSSRPTIHERTRIVEPPQRSSPSSSASSFRRRLRRSCSGRSAKSDGRLVPGNYEVYAWASAHRGHGSAVVIACASTWRLIPELPVGGVRRKLSLLDPVRDVRQALRNRNFRWIFLATIAIGASTGVTTILGTYTWAYFWEFSTGQAGALTLFSLVPTFVAFAPAAPARGPLREEAHHPLVHGHLHRERAVVVRGAAARACCP